MSASELGERLRQTREARGISLSQAAADTRILQRYLVALERGEYQYLPGDVYTRGFIRNYAQYLGLSAEELIEAYRQERGVTDQIRVVPATSAPSMRGCAPPTFFAVFFVVLSLIGVTYLFFQLTGQVGEVATLPTSAPTRAPATPTGFPTSPVQPTSPLAAAGTPVAGGLFPTAALTTAPSPTQDAPIVVEVTILPGDNSWMQIDVDGNRVFQGTMTSGQVEVFKAQRNIAIRAGNAAFVQLRLNGQAPIRLGETPGQVFTWRWPQ